jgi:U3 small nucleolar RNA-associated protein 16
MHFRQQVAEKRKRQEKSTRLEKQAKENKDKISKTAVKLSKASVPEPPPTAPGSDEDDAEDAEDDEDDEPDLLPAELLETDFTRPPTPPPTGESDKITLPSKVIKLDNEPPRDRKVGTVTVSVLPKANDLLPPKATAESRKLREHWLAGKRKVGKKGAVAVERRSFGGGFVKKR